MKSILKKTLITVSCSAMLLLTACNDDDKAVVTEKYFVSETPYRVDSLAHAKTIDVIRYNMKNVQGKTVETTALMMFPRTVRPKDGWRVVVWEHGTVGVGDQCAPSVNPLGKNFRGLAEKLLELGYVIVAPDYEGLGTAGIHPYLNMRSEAESALAAIKAINQRYAKQLNGAWMSVGQSQGGQASLGTAELANNNPLYKGAVAGAPASSLGKIILDIAPTALRKLEKREIDNHITDLEKRSSVSSYATLLAYAALTGVGIKAYEPSFEYRNLFQPEAKHLAQLAYGTDGDDGQCLQSDDPEKSLVQNFKKDIIQFMQMHEDKSVVDYPGLDADAFKTNTVVTQFLADSQPGTQRLDKPVLIIQGEVDTNVPAIVTETMVDKLQGELKSPDVRLIVVAGAGHTEAIVRAQQELLDFIQEHMPVQ